MVQLSRLRQAQGKGATMTIGTLLLIVLIIFLLGGFSGRFGGPGYGYGNRGNGLIGVLLIIVIVLLLTGPSEIGRASCRERVL